MPAASSSNNQPQAAASALAPETASTPVPEAVPSLAAEASPKAGAAPDVVSSIRPETLSPLTIEQVRVRADRIELTVRVAALEFLTTTPALMERILRRYPTLRHHTCRNERGLLFSAVMNHTSTPHVLEHLIVDEQARTAQNSDRVFTGTTQATAEDPLFFVVAVSFEDDLRALRAITTAAAFLNGELLAAARALQ